MRKVFLLLSVFLSFSLVTLPAQGEEVAKKSSLKLIKTIEGSIAPKSVRTSNDGIISAHNMMYKHSITIYDAKTFELLKLFLTRFHLRTTVFQRAHHFLGAHP